MISLTKLYIVLYNSQNIYIFDLNGELVLSIKDEDYNQVAHISNYDSQFHLTNIKAGNVYNIKCKISDINLSDFSELQPDCRSIWKRRC